MFGFGAGRGCRGGMGMMGRGGWEMAEGYGWPYWGWGQLPFSKETEIEMLKRYKDRLELRKKEIDAEIKSIEERIKTLEK
ncbi:MAG: hypothetical protein D6814_02490 [Calditrichaeota bacterium]|nr:MAG: hypothetical protein D6814_02490 [Calditrichota bacterium]